MSATAPVPIGKLFRHDGDYGSPWGARLLAGKNPLFRARVPWTLEPGRHQPPLRELLLINRHPQPVRFEIAGLFENGWHRRELGLAPGHHRSLERLGPLALKESRRLELRLVGPDDGAATFVLAHNRVPVIALERSTLRAGTVGALAKSLDRLDFEALQARFRPYADDAFPDTDVQHQLHREAGRRFSSAIARWHSDVPPPCRPSPIPPAIHWIWLRHRGTPSVFDTTELSMMATWQRHHPDFELHLWTDFEPSGFPFSDHQARSLFEQLFGRRLRWHGAKELRDLVASLDLPNTDVLLDLLSHTGNAAIRSDVARLAVLYSRGGVYCDVNDTECLGSFDSACRRFSLVLGLDPFNRLHNAVLAAAPRHPLLRSCLEGVRTSAAELTRRLRGARDTAEYFRTVIGTCGPLALSRRLGAMLQDRALGPETLILPFPYFHNPRPLRPLPQSLVSHHCKMTWIRHRMDR